MQSLAVDLLLLRSLETTGPRIAPGRVLSARVMELLPGGRGLLSVAGAAVEAQLPEGLQPGQELRLVVREVSEGRVLLGVAGHEPAASAAQAQAPAAQPSAAQASPAQTAAQAAVAAVTIPLPGGGTLRRIDPDPGAGRGPAEAPDAHAVALRYEAPALGGVDLHIRIDPVSLAVTVRASAGDGLARLEGGAESLRSALGAAGGERAVRVTVSPRHEPLDVYA